MNNREKALALVSIGVPVFKVRITPEGAKTPMHPRGHLDATLDPGLADDWFTESPNAHVGAYMGAAGLLAVDVDVKNGKDGWESLDLSWLPVPSTFSYKTPTDGTHLIYTAPEGLNLAPSANYRGLDGVDIRAGSSWVLWNGDVPTSREAFSPAPEWALDTVSVKSAERFEGTLKDWFEDLEPGTPNALVRHAIDRIKDDMSHSDMVAATFEAIRLGAEGSTGVPVLLEALEDAWIKRDPGNHTTPEEHWEFKFHESLSSGIEKFGSATELRKSLPAYSLNIVPSAVPDRLISGAPGNKDTFRELLAELTKATDDDLLITSVLWNSPRTRDISREWGLAFVHERVTSARTRPEPVRENPTLEERTPVQPNEIVEKTEHSGFLTDAEQAQVDETHTFIDTYVEATRAKGFTNLIYAIPSAWTCLSMAFGRRAFIPLSKPLEVNLWMIILGESTTGKGTEDRFLRGVLNAMFLDGETDNYNLGALSSPDGLHLGLINRDGLPSIIHNDEASDFFRDIRTKDWMAPVPDKLAKWYDSFVEPSSKISLKDARGKSAQTSLNQLMWGTPDRMLTLLDASQFESGYLARVNWVWDGTIPDPNRKSDLKLQENMKRETPDEVYDVAADLLHAGKALQGRVAVGGTEKAQKRLNKAADDFRRAARKSSRYTFFKPAVDRLVMETLWKCAALLALYRGDKEFTELDAWVAIHYASDWLLTLMKVAESISESPYSRDLEEMESFIRDEGGSVSRAKLLHNFRGKIMRSGREIEDRIGFLIDSGRVLRTEVDRKITYELNGS